MTRIGCTLATLVMFAGFLEAQGAKPTVPQPNTPPPNTQPPVSLSVPIRGFNLVLLVAEPQGAIPTEGLSAQARKALLDVREFLPYKGFRVIDAQWVSGTGQGTSRISGRLRAPENGVYDFILNLRPRQDEPSRLVLGVAITLISPMTAVSSQRVILDTSFNMRPDETVVAGTSYLQGDQALVLLLTAAGETKQGR